MSEFLNQQTMKLVYRSSDNKERQPEPDMMKSLERRGSGLLPASQLEKIDEFFHICDSEGKGYITPTDMKRLNTELPLSVDELENVFDSLDFDRNGYLTLEEFSSGFSKFLQGRRMSQVEDQLRGLSQDCSDALYQNDPQDYEEESHFSMLMESLGASNIFEDPNIVRTLWIQLRKDEPHLLYSFEDFLARVTSQIRVAQQEKSEMESALRKKAVTHNGEIQQLYEEMEQQIKNENARMSHKDLRSQDLQQQLSSKEQELEWLFLKQKGLEQQCQELHIEHKESQLENIKLKMANQELSCELQNTIHELSLAQEQLDKLQEQALRHQQEKDMEVYKIIERLQREKQNLVLQLDLLREMNIHLRDDQDSLKRNQKKSTLELGPISTSNAHSDRKQSAESVAGTKVTQHPNRKTSSHNSSPHSTSRDDGMMIMAKHTACSGGNSVTENPDPVDSLRHHRLISIEEDHLPHLLKGELCPHFHQMNEDEEGAQIDLQMSPMFPSNMSLASLTRGQPVGKEALQKGQVESSVSTPQRLFKIILAGDTSVGKTAILQRFCDGHFRTDTTATVGIDFSVQTLKLGDSHVALQLWDTAGQERFKSITKQFFRKADGVVLTYDITLRDSFKSVRPWLMSIQEAVGGPVPIMLLGNKSDRESMRQVATGEGEKLAKEACLLFYECSAYTGYNVQEAMVHLARILKEQEDRVWEKTVRLGDQSGKKKTCCI
ncbi:EF-hand calcium-binding domain-containing protein 4B isoform X1 [Tachysurus fulvidraco]|uniref:EF-hand calcium-binding domain-containing protein 4B isoform X1 n=2 Tax=Tachysurus fulvidraco TaxID=1234273 RepID=UPI000F4EB4DD|nr:EF-hand calcium-binding domain-containing protein 4B isoform X1 [Tachysurus fulvidraco]